MVNGTKQNPDSYQFPRNYHVLGNPCSLLSFEDSKVMIQQKMETEMEHRQCPQVPIPGSFPKSSPSSFALAPPGHGEPA